MKITQIKMESEVTSDEADSWSLDFIYESAEGQIDLGNFNEAKKLCVHGQSESSKKNNKTMGERFNGLYIDIEKMFDEKRKKILENEGSEELDQDVIPNEIVEDNPLTSVVGVGPSMAQILFNEGILTIEQLAENNPIDLSQIKGIGQKTAEKIITNAKSYRQAKSKKSEFKSIQEFAEKPPINNEAQEMDIEISDSSIPFREVIINDGIVDLMPNLDRLNENNHNNMDEPKADDIEIKGVNEKEVDGEDGSIANEIIEEFMKDSKEEHKNPEISRVNEVDNQKSDVSVVGDEMDGYFIENPIQDSIVSVEYLDKRTIESMVSDIGDVLSKQGFYSLYRDPRSSLEAIFRKIHVISYKKISISEDVHQIIILPIKVCNLTGRFILSEERQNYQSLRQDSIDESKKREFVNKNIRIHRDLRDEIFLNIMEEGTIFQKIRKWFKISNLTVDRTKSNRPLFLRSGEELYKISINPILICKECPAFLEKLIRFPYIKFNNLHVIEEHQLKGLIKFIESKYETIAEYGNEDNSIKNYAELEKKFFNDVGLYSVPFIIYGFIFLMIIVFQVHFLINTFIILTIGIFGLYALICLYLYIKFNKERKAIIIEFNTPEYNRSAGLEESDLHIIKNKLSPDYLKQFIFECFTKREINSFTTDIDQIKISSQIQSQESESTSFVIESSKEVNSERKVKSRYMSLLED